MQEIQFILFLSIQSFLTMSDIATYLHIKNNLDLYKVVKFYVIVHFSNKCMHS